MTAKKMKQLLDFFESHKIPYEVDADDDETIVRVYFADLAPSAKKEWQLKKESSIYPDFDSFFLDGYLPSLAADIRSIVDEDEWEEQDDRWIFHISG